MVTYALDSNIISYLLRDNEDVKQCYRQELQTGNDVLIPPMVRYEVKRWLLLKNATAKMALFEQLSEFSQPDIDKTVWDKAISLYVASRRNGKPIEDFDLLIAAYCLVNDFILVTNNIRHFEGISGLRLTNWKDQPSDLPI
ncbi:MAG: PIN domain-containing protein [Clostridiales bacterium]|jgi:tRNA(fMet)-specific endonuclease VapC|nr:PIN domain-containing protein [Clostridiales bacterium]